MGVRLPAGQTRAHSEAVDVGSDAVRRGAEGLPGEPHQAPPLCVAERKLRGTTPEAPLLPSHQEGGTGGEQQQSRVGQNSTDHGQQQEERQHRAVEDYR